MLLSYPPQEQNAFWGENSHIEHSHGKSQPILKSFPFPLSVVSFGPIWNLEQYCINEKEKHFN